MPRPRGRSPYAIQTMHSGASRPFFANETIGFIPAISRYFPQKLVRIIVNGGWKKRHPPYAEIATAGNGTNHDSVPIPSKSAPTNSLLQTALKKKIGPDGPKKYSTLKSSFTARATGTARSEPRRAGRPAPPSGGRGDGSGGRPVRVAGDLACRRGSARGR